MFGLIETAAAALALTMAGPVGADHFEVKTFGPSLVKVGARQALDGDYERAERFTRRALEEPISSRSKAIAWANLCAIEARQGEMESAAEACDAAITANPDSELALRNRAALRFQQGDYAQAETDLTALLAEHKDSRAEALLAEIRSARTRLATAK